MRIEMQKKQLAGAATLLAATWAGAVWIDNLQEPVSVALAQAPCGPDYTTATLTYEVNIEDFSACVVAGDWAPALVAIQQECEDLHPSEARGCTVRFACGREYNIDSTVDVCTSMHFKGCGGALNLLGSTIRATTATTAFRVPSTAQGCPFTLDNAMATPRPVWENIGVRTGIVDPADPIYCIEAFSPFTTMGVECRGFTQNYRMVADVEVSPATNVNNSMVFNSRSTNSEHGGAFLAGGDSNASWFIGFDATSACRRASDWTSLTPSFCITNPSEPQCTLPCAGMMDFSFLGNTHLSHFASAFDALTLTNYPGLLNGGPNNESVFMVYDEGSPAESFINSRAVAIALSNKINTSMGFVLHGQVANGLRVLNDRNADRLVEFQLGRATNVDGAFWALQTFTRNAPPNENTYTAHPWPPTMTFDDSLGALGRYRLELRSTDPDPWQLGQTDNPGVGGQLYMPATLFSPNGDTLNFQNQATVCQ